MQNPSRPSLSLSVLFTVLALLLLGPAAHAQTYTLGAASLVEGPAAGGDSVALTVSTSMGVWTAAANNSWLHVTTGSASGAGSATVFLTFDENTGATRQGTFTIGGETLTITQAGSGYVAAAFADLTAAGFGTAAGVAVDANGNVYISDPSTNAIAKYTAATQKVSTLVSGLNQPAGVAVDGAGNVFIADTANNMVKVYTAGESSPSLIELVYGVTGPTCVAVDSHGNVYFNDGLNNIYQYIPSPQAINTLVQPSSGVVAAGLAVDGNGNVYIADKANKVIAEYSATSQTVSTLVSGLSNPDAVALDGSGNLYIADSGNGTIKEWIASTQTLTTLASPLSPTGVAVDGSGKVYFYDGSTHALDEYSGPADGVTVLASSVAVIGAAYGVAVDRNGNAFIADSFKSTIEEYVASTGQVVDLQIAGLKNPSAVAVDQAGAIYIADTGNGALEKYVAAGTPVLTALISTGLTTPAGVAVDVAGNVYVSDSGGNTIQEYTAGGSAVTLVPSTAGLSQPAGLAVDGLGNLYIADQGNGVVKKYTAATQALTTLVSTGLSQPAGVALDGCGNLFISDPGNDAIEEYTAAGVLVARVPSSAGRLNLKGVAVDASGDVFFTSGDLFELPRAFVDSATKLELPPAGSDTLPAVVPGSFNLIGPFAPSATVAWLNFTSISAGVVGFSFPAYSGPARTGDILVLGQSIEVTQGPSLAPVAATYRVFLTGAGSISIPVLTDDTSPLGYSLKVTSVTQPSFGKVTLNANNTVTYTTKGSFATFNGTDSFNYTITDGHGGTATGTVNLLNPFESTKGSYDALLAPSGGGASDGYYTLSLSDTGSFTGSLKLAGVSYSFSGAFNLSGVANVSIKRAGATPITGVLTLNLSTFNNLSVSFTANGVTSTASTAAREQYTAKSPAPSAGVYTVQLSPPAAPIGTAATATATVTGGKLTAIGLGGGGSGYVTAPRVVITGPPGAGATATAIVSGGAVTGFTINAPGAKYPATGTVVTIDPPSAGLPQGTGWATMTVSAIGGATVAGKLGDGTAFTFGGYITKGTVRDSFAFYLPLYSGISKPNAPGSILGTITFESLTVVGGASVNSECDGLLAWLKPVQTTGALYKSGFSTSVRLYGGRYVAPKSAQALTFTNKTAGAGTFQAGSSLSNTISVSSKNVVTVAGPNADKLKLTITAATGLFYGSVYDASVKLTYPISGVLYQDSNSGVGLYLGPSQAGSVAITPQ